MKIGLFFGSFNPVHTGHMIIANYMVEYTDLDKVWMVLSPHNPFKKKQDLANDYDRLHLLNLAIGSNHKIKSSQVEFKLPKPSYTIDTLRFLKTENPDHEYVVIMGGDNIEHFDKWKEYKSILKDHDIYVYRRKSADENKFDKHPRVKIIEAPLIEISGTAIRKALKNKKSIQYLVPEAVFEYLSPSHLYR